MWTDSTTVLQWLHFLEKQPMFVANRVAEILELTTADEWYHVQSADNPADAGTRGLSAKALLQSSWLIGPKFLKTNEWPFKPSGDFRLKLKQAKPDPTDEPSTETCTLLSETQDANAKTFEWQKYGSYEKLLRIAAYVLRLLSRNKDHKTNSCVITDPAELENSEQRLLYLTQAESFHAEKSNNLLKSTPLSKSSKIVRFSPFIGPNGLLPPSGRTRLLETATFDVKHPILLDARHPLVRLLLEHLHSQHCHQGVDYLRALVQQRFAVVKLRAVLRTIVSRCLTCRKRKAETLTPIMSDLPRERLAFKEPPFSNSGIDYFGPFFVSVKRSTEKRWGFLFTCLTTSAVHFEVVPSMDTSSCVMGIERFCARRGIPSVIKNWNQQVLSESLVKKGIKWKFNPPSAPPTEVFGNV